MPRSTKSSSWERTWLLLLFAGALVLLGTASIPQLDGDVPFYGRIAKNVLTSGDWLTLRHPVFGADVPPLTIWLMAISLRVGGDSDVALRLWHVVFGLGLILATYRIARLSAGREVALLASLLLLTIQQVLWWSLVPKQDLPLTLFLAAAFYAYLRYRLSGQMFPAALTGFWLALAVLTKGFAAVAVFGLVAGADLVVASGARGSDRRLHWRWTGVGAAAALFLAVATPWFLLGALRQGGPFVTTHLLSGSPTWRLLTQYTPSGILGWLEGFGYVPMLVFGLLPWSGLLPAAIAELRRSLRSGEPVLRFCALWAAVVFVTLVLIPGPKSMRYLLLCYPPIVVLAARALDRAADEQRRLAAAAIIPLAVAVAMVVVGLWVPIGTTPERHRLFLPINMPAFIASLPALGIAAAAFFWKRARLAVAVMAAGVLISHGVYAWSVSHHWERLYPWRAVADAITRLSHPGDHVLVVSDVWGESNYLNYLLDGPVARPVDEATFSQAWAKERVFGLLPEDLHAKWQDRLAGRMLVQMPAGWVLVTNR